MIAAIVTRFGFIVRFVEQDLVSRSFEIVVLTRLDRPVQHGADQPYEDQRQGNEQEQGFHEARQGRPVRVRRAEFAVTSSELADMPSAASHGGTHPEAASGRASRL